MASSDYVELRCRSAFSFLDGASLPEELVARAVELGLPALALADRDGLYGAPRFYRAARQLLPDAGSGPECFRVRPASWTMEPLLGAELTLESGANLLVLVESDTGYRNLSRLLTRGRVNPAAHPRRVDGRTGKTTPALPWSIVAEHAAGLVALTGAGEGDVGRALDAGDDAAARRALDTLVEVFGAGNVYGELQRHFDPDEELRNRRLIALARRHALPLVATNDVRYARASDRRLHDVLLCTRHKCTVDEIGRRLPRNAERHLKPAAEMAALFADLPSAITCTRAVAERCRYTLADLGYRFPDYETPDGQTLQQHLEQLTWQHAERRFQPLTDEARRQLTHELATIGKLDLAGYFLIVWDLVEHCRRRGIMTQGRGSAANSAVCYALGITAVDPVKMKLLFERFLSEERGEWPDIDLDLPSGDDREEVIQYVYAKYGAPRVAMTANVITYRSKMAVRDAGRALGFSESQLERMSRMLGGFGYRDGRDTIAAQLAEAGFTVADERTALLVELAGKLLGLPRHLGQHSGGMVIARGRLDEVVPLEPASMPGRVVVQWDKDDCADLGLIKIDLLGLGMMAALAEALPLVEAHEGVKVDLAHLPPDDPAIYDLLCAADTVGLFQVESRAQMATLPRLRPRVFYDLVIQVAIIRPGPIVGDMLHPYLRRRAGREPADPLHPLLAEVLDRTLGVPLFQEQLMRMAMIVADFTGGEAEEIRRAMGFKRSHERMEAIEGRLRAGMARKGITGETADRIVKSITAFALYGFPESHAASFALLAYASAYLKVHHPTAFVCALLNNWPMGFYHPSTLVTDAERHGVRVRPIDVTRSSWRCTLEPDEESHNGQALRLGLRYVSGLGEPAARGLLAARDDAPFSSLADLGARSGVAREHLRRMAEIGALASLPGGRSRRSALWQLEGLERSGPLFSGSDPTRGGAGARDGDGDGASAPDGDDDGDGDLRVPASPLAEMSEREAIAADYRIAGVTTQRHPMSLRRAELDRAGVVPASRLGEHPNRSRVRVAGHVITRQRPGTAKGFFFITLEDETGLANAIISPQHFAANRPLLVGAAALVIEGVLQHLDGTLSVKADRFRTLDEVTPPSHDFH